ncbi:C-X-C chemokine receptor type 3-like [Brachionichthys hirsutus]|uniref:C-X-C chemokine receptor type 3-like n=1 Tax=Brachionichthys hirsutus TaxID=412623 RepID=UPI003604B781
MDVVLDGIFRQNVTYDYDSDYEYKDDLEPKNSEVLIPLLYSVVLIVGLLGNGLVLAALVWKRRFWTISDIFVLHLSVADVLLLVMLPFLAAQSSQTCGWCFKGFVCKITGAAFNINFYCGIFLLLCIGLDRCLSMAHARRLFSQKRPALAHISCLLVWLCSLILSIPDWIFMGARKDPSHEKLLCVHKYAQSQTDWRLKSRLLHHMLGFLLPAAALIICWSCVLLRLQHGLKSLQKVISIKVNLSLVALFFLCWVPYNITLLADTVRSRPGESNDLSVDSEGSIKTALVVTSALGCVHACLRPLLYLGLCANFKKQILGLLRRAAADSERSLWELGVGEDVLHDRRREGEELKQMTGVDHQIPSAQC